MRILATRTVPSLHVLGVLRPYFCLHFTFLWYDHRKCGCLSQQMQDDPRKEQDPTRIVSVCTGTLTSSSQDIADRSTTLHTITPVSVALDRTPSTNRGTK